MTYKKIKIVTDASCYKKGFYKGNSTGAAKFYDEVSGVLVHEEEYVLGDMTAYSAEAETILRALNTASEYTRDNVSVWSDNQVLIRHMNGDYLLKADDSKRYFDQIKNLELRVKNVKYYHHDRSTSLAKIAHVSAKNTYSKHHIN